ncbi:hypothetical protein FVF75_06160 [Maritimibacter fusiformis]|uniref:Uncharacterized protein n=2 Tax=Maritimibacter fusiformis TaxID=2603819 RepID=A0A5D0RLH0_9RHOB|nr:hypothetical protein FVF75_06160 [Maritimibacter fusiformis]
MVVQKNRPLPPVPGDRSNNPQHPLTSLALRPSRCCKVVHAKVSPRRENVMLTHCETLDFKVAQGSQSNMELKVNLLYPDTPAAIICHTFPRLPAGWRKLPFSQPAYSDMRTNAICADYGIHVGDVRDYLEQNPSFFAWRKVLRRAVDSPHRHPTLILGVRAFVPGSFYEWHVALVVVMPITGQRNPFAKELAWATLDGKWPLVGNADQVACDGCAARALAWAGGHDPYIELMARRAFVFNPYTTWARGGCGHIPHAFHCKSMRTIARLIMARAS